MNAPSLELTLARLYTDHEFRSRFLADPQEALRDCKLTAEDYKELIKIDKTGLIMASQSFLHKRRKRKRSFLNKLKFRFVEVKRSILRS